MPTSYTLTMHDAEGKYSACTDCQNAIWQSIDREESDDITIYNHLECADSNIKVACWCTLMHMFIKTPRITCDGNVSEDEPEFDDVIHDKTNS